ncbi:hypothetical protein JCM39194_08490 [Desulfotomaculum varum]
MFVNDIKNIKKVDINAPGVAGASKQTLIGPAQGWDGWVMRQFYLESGGHTPRHSHPWPHINYIISGQGSLYLNGQICCVEPGSVAYIPAGSEHQFINNSQQDFSFICIVPVEGDI